MSGVGWVDNEIVIDNFACGGGASEGIENALGRPVDYAVNHNAKALAVHRANHPRTTHLLEDMRDLDPRSVGRNRRIGLCWFSPDCTYFSAARGGRPFRDRNRARRIRGLPWTVPHWAKLRRPRVIMLENVREFQDWGPLLEDGTPCKARRGATFRRWHRQLENLGYQVDMRILSACDYGARTTRRRLFVIARCDGGEIIFPEATHGPGLQPYGTAADCIDWSVECPSIFERDRPLADATCRRIARGIMRYVIHNAKPFIIGIDNRSNGARDAWSTTDPLRTITTENRFALVAPTLIQTSWGERQGQAPRCLDLFQPLGTIVAQGNKHALVTAFLARHYGGHENDGAELSSPIPTITTKDHHALVTSHLIKFKGTCRDGQRVDEPLHTIQAGGQHYGEVRSFFQRHFTGDGPGRSGQHDRDTVSVRVGGDRYDLIDVGMRMLLPRELARAHLFRDSYVLDPVYDGRPLSKSDQIWMLGNSVPPIMSEALVKANVVEQREGLAA